MNIKAPSCTSMMKHLESVHNAGIEEEAKTTMAQKRLRFGRDATAVACIQRYNKLWQQKGPRFSECVKTIAEMCAWDNLLLHFGERPGFMAFIRTVDVRYPQIRGGSVTRSVAEQTDEVVKSIWCTMSQACAETDVLFTCDM